SGIDLNAAPLCGEPAYSERSIALLDVRKRDLCFRRTNNALSRGTVGCGPFRRFLALAIANQRVVGWVELLRNPSAAHDGFRKSATPSYGAKAAGTASSRPTATRPDHSRSARLTAVSSGVHGTSPMFALSLSPAIRCGTFHR